MNAHEVMNLVASFNQDDVIIIDWLDACTIAGDWTEKTEFYPEEEIKSHAYVSTSGFFFKVTDKGIVIVQSTSDDAISDGMFIPFGMILDIRKLEDVNVRANFTR